MRQHRAALACALSALITAVHAMAPPGPRAIARRESMRVLIADVGPQAAWFPGDRQAIKRPSPSQAAALRAAALEAMVSEGDAPPLVAMLPTVTPAAAEVQSMQARDVPK